MDPTIINTQEKRDSQKHPLLEGHSAQTFCMRPPALILAILLITTVVSHVQRGVGISSALCFQMAKMEKGEKKGKKPHPTLSREWRRPTLCPEVTPSCLVLALLCTSTSLAVLCAWPSRFCAEPCCRAGVSSCTREGSPGGGATLHASTAPGQGPHAAHTDPPSSITSDGWWWASSFGSREKTQGRDLNGEDIQVGKIKSHVETGGLAAVYRGSTRLTLRGEGFQAPLVLSWVGNVAVSQLIHAQRTPMPTLLTKPHFRRKEKTSARAGERGEHASDAGCPSCRFPEPLRLAAAAAFHPGAGCRQHSGARTLAQSNKKSPYHKPAGAEQTGSGPLRL